MGNCCHDTISYKDSEALITMIPFNPENRTAKRNQRRKYSSIKFNRSFSHDSETGYEDIFEVTKTAFDPYIMTLISYDEKKEQLKSETSKLGLSKASTGFSQGLLRFSNGLSAEENKPDSSNTTLLSTFPDIHVMVLNTINFLKNTKR